MIKTNDFLREELAEYSNKNTKISREVKKGNLIRIVNGLYETDKNINPYLLAGVIYGPSYLSFDFALAYYGLIPEKVVTYTSATCNKGKKKIYENEFGRYIYRDVPQEVYPLGVKLLKEGEYTFQIATAEKALCDKLYTINPVKNIKELEKLLFDDLRIDKTDFLKLNISDIEMLSKWYHCTNIRLLYKYMRRKNNE